jgi:hypothetical protein
MSPLPHVLTNESKVLNVRLLCGKKRESPKVWNNLFHKISDLPNLELQRVVRAIRPDVAAFPSLLDHV